MFFFTERLHTCPRIPTAVLPHSGFFSLRGIAPVAARHVISHTHTRVPPPPQDHAANRSLPDPRIHRDGQPRWRRGTAGCEAAAAVPVPSPKIAAAPPACSARGLDPACTKGGGALTPTIGTTISTRSTTTTEAVVAFFSHAQELSRGQGVRR
jgi:hypothetical protein